MNPHFIDNLEDFIEGALDALPDYLNKPNTRKMLTIELERLETLENAIIALGENRLLENAEGFILDEIGTQVGKYRGGMSDNAYKSSINIYQSSLKNCGTRSDATAVLDSLFPESSYFLYKGKNYRIDLYGKSKCFNINDLTADIVDIFPIITHLRIIEMPLSGSPFGFEGDPSSSGFAGSTNRLYADAGKLCRTAYCVDDVIHEQQQS